jgi:hypothetical protein
LIAQVEFDRRDVPRVVAPSWLRFKLSAPQSCRDASEIAGFRAAVLKVRIHLSPAESQQTFGSFRVVAIKM